MLFIVITWLAISTYWTGNERIEKITPETNNIITPSLVIPPQLDSSESSVIEESKTKVLGIEDSSPSAIISSSESSISSGLKY